MSDERIERVRRVIAETTSVDVASIGPDDDLVETLDLDSLAALRVLALVEKRLEIRFDERKLTGLRTLRRIAAATERHAGDTEASCGSG